MGVGDDEKGGRNNDCTRINRQIVVQNNSRGPSRSKSSFHQQARVAMMAVGIESAECSKPTDEYGIDHKVPRQSNT